MSAFDDLAKGGTAPSGNAFDKLASGGSAFDQLASGGNSSPSFSKRISGAIQYGKAHPFEATLGILGTPQRMLQAAETGNDIGHAATHFDDRDKLSKAVRDKIGLSALEAGPLAGDDLPHKVTRFGLDAALDIGNDPLNVIPVGKLTEGIAKGAQAIGKAVPAIGKAAETVSEPARKLLDPNYYLRGVKPEAQARFEQVTNQAMEHVRSVQDAENALVKKHADAIRAGQMPDEIARLFAARNKNKGISSMDAWKEYFKDPKTGALPTALPKGTTPQQVQRALFQDRAPIFAAEAKPKLAEFFQHPSGYKVNPAASPYLEDFHNGLDEKAIEETQKRLEKAIESKVKPESSSAILRGAKAVVRRGNQAFLANPVPHTLNLTDFAYLRYGPATAAKGLVNAAKVATGKVDPTLQAAIDELKAGGGNSQYGNIFDELGLSRIANIPGSEGAAKAVNKVIVPFERASNYAQHKVLNSTEQGLRAAALADLKKRGITGPQAMRDIHAAFGTDAPNMLTEGANMVGQPFAQFGLQSALGSAARTAAKNPQRLSAPLKLNLDFNDEVNPGSSPKYMMANPTADAAKALTNSLDYFPNHAFGPLYQAAKGYSALSQAQKGEVVKALTQAGQQFVPGGNDDIQTLIRALTGKKGSAGDSALQDVGPDIFGGYMSKAKR